MGDAADQLAHAAGARARDAAPREQNGRAVVGLEHAAEVGEEHVVPAAARVVGRAQPRVDAASGASFGDQEALALAAEVDAPALGGRENGAVERLEAHGAQLAASPATVAGRPSHDPSGDNAAPSPTAQP